MKKKEYRLSFIEALEIVLNKGCVKGENFAIGYFLKLNKHGQLVLVDANNLYKEIEFINMDSLNNQKFRELSVMTIKELSY